MQVIKSQIKEVHFWIFCSSEYQQTFSQDLNQRLISDDVQILSDCSKSSLYLPGRYTQSCEEINDLHFPSDAAMLLLTSE